MIAGEESGEQFILYTHSDEVTKALFKLGFNPDDQYTHEGITLWKYALPNKEVLKNPILAKHVMESALDLKHIVRRLLLPLYTVGDSAGIFQCVDHTKDAYLGLSRDPELLNEILQNNRNSGIRTSVIPLSSYQELYDTLRDFQASGIKYVVRFLDTKIVEKYFLDTVITAVSFMLEDGPHDPLSTVTAASPKT